MAQLIPKVILLLMVLLLLKVSCQKLKKIHMKCGLVMVVVLI
nr:MAG TPA: hypothetical protein [Caudoviricetes sp.]